MPSWISHEWMTMTEWLEPKLLVFFVLVGGVLFLARRGRGGDADNAERRVAALLKHGKQ
jgi:hypothetical protein